MKLTHLQLLCDPETREDLKLVDPVYDGDEIISGVLASTTNHYRIIREIPRFVTDEGYSDIFGYQWNRWAPNAHYYIFSDQLQGALARIPLPDDRVTLVSHNHGDAMAYADLWFMTQCQHFVIANSTFSWWGAWLASNAGKIVISPGRICALRTAWGFKGLIPIDWTVIKVEA